MTGGLRWGIRSPLIFVDDGSRAEREAGRVEEQVNEEKAEDKEEEEAEIEDPEEDQEIFDLSKVE